MCSSVITTGSRIAMTVYFNGHCALEHIVWKRRITNVLLLLLLLLLLSLICQDYVHIRGPHPVLMI